MGKLKIVSSSIVDAQMVNPTGDRINIQYKASANKTSIEGTLADHPDVQLFPKELQKKLIIQWLWMEIFTR